MKKNITKSLFRKSTFIKFCFLSLFLFQNATIKAQCCNYTLSMHDSYGDGWNGGYLDVYINASLVGTYSAANYFTSVNFLICDGDSLKLVYTAGSYENENSYQLFDAAWNPLFSNGPNPQVGIVYTTTGNCSTLAVPGNYPCTAIPLDTGQCIIADNTGFPISGYNAGCASNNGPDIWFKVTVPPTGCVSIATDSGSINDTGLAIWTDTTCTNLHSLACDDDSGVGYFSFISLYNLVPGQQLYVQVWGYNGATGTFRICANTLHKIVLDSTNLPLVMINTLGNTIVQNTKVNAHMYIKYNGPGTIVHFTDSANVYNGDIGIAIHGASSAGYPQHPYSIETRTTLGLPNNVPLLGMPAQNDWVMISNFNDLSLVRNTLAHKLFREMGNYSPRNILCETFVDSAYQGIYVFCEKLKRDHNRVNIAKLTLQDNTGDSVSGGYILQQNIWDASNSFQSNYSPIDHPGLDVHYLYEYPAFDSITPAQKTYIASYIDSLETALYSSNFSDSAAGYRKYLDTKSFIDYFLVNELSRNNDGFKKSVFFNKNRYSKGGKFKAGPIWDFDWAWKDLYGCSMFFNSNGSGWAYLINDCATDNNSNGYYVRLLQDTTFCNELRCRYNYFRLSILSTPYINNYIDSMKTLVQQAQARHFQKWPILGMSGPAPEMNAVATTYDGVMDTLKSWINRRLTWLDANMPGHCQPVHLDVKPLNTHAGLNYFPNPSTGLIHFEGRLPDTSPLVMTVYDVTGKEIDRKNLPSGTINFDYRIEEKGVYYFKINNNTGMIQYGKLIIL